MKAITKTQEIVVGYEAEDGTWFNSEEQCRAYEQTARSVIKTQWQKLGNVFNEHNIPFSFEDCVRVIDVKDMNTVVTVNMYGKECCWWDSVISSDMIGKRVAVVTGYDDCDIYGVYTREELEKKFADVVSKLFDFDTEKEG